MKKRPKKFDRGSALSGRPERLPAVSSKETDGGGLNVTISLTPRRWLRWLKSSDRQITRTFSLDALGREVYWACDGKSNVSTIVRRFAEAHKLSIAEAEISVTTFLKTLMSKGLVAVAVDRKKKR